MRGQPTRLVAIVVLLLGAVLLSPWFGRSIVAASQRHPDQGKAVFFPVVYMRPVASTVDLRIVHMGLNQSVQNSANSVTLVAGKPALLRIYAQTNATAPAPVAEVTVRATRGGQNLGSVTVGPQAVATAPTADDLSSTFNLELPREWLLGDVTLTATIDAVNTVVEYDETNNARTEAYSFRSVLPLALTIVPIYYTDSRSGRLYTAEAHDPISRWLLSAFPLSQVDVRFHTPFHFTGDLRQGTEWQRLLQELTTLWAAEVGFGSGHVFYGLIPVGDAAGASWFEGGVSGLGWIGQRVAIGLDVGEATGESAGHELGHNFGRRHAPCGNPTSVDPAYPYPNATIGVYGVDTVDDTLLAPNANFDMMSYCGPEWVSDYTYEGLLQDQLARGGREAAKGSGLLIRAAVDGETVTALPVYALDRAAPAMFPTSDYTVELLDGSGAILSTHPAALLEADETGVSARMLVAQVSASIDGVSVVRFRRGDAVVAERVLGGGVDRDAVRGGVEWVDEAAALSWSAGSTPALVRFSADGATWRTIAADVVGGKLTVAGDMLPAQAGWFQIVQADGGETVTLKLP